MQLFIIRHGESANNALGVGDISYDDYMAQRTIDPPLTQIGKRQARLAADHLAADNHPESRNGTPLASTRAGYGIQTLYCSAMLRALQTAQPIGEALGLRPEVWVEIHEHGGLFHGNPRRDEVASAGGLAESAIAAQFPGYVIPHGVTDEGWWRGGYEDIAQCEIRAEQVALDLRALAQADANSVIAMVTHGTFIDRLLKALLNVGGVRDFFFFHYNTAITRVDFVSEERLVMRYTNRTQHLPAELITK